MADQQGMEDCVRIAAVDLGTVSSRLALARVRDGRIVELTKHSIITDMGRGVDASGAFDAAAIERVEAACAQFAEEARAFGAAATCVTLTSAARDASNADELLDRLAALGFIPQVIPGEVEARLTFYGVAHDFPGERIAVADPGGGSTEIVVGSYLPDAAALELERVHSFNIGCRRLTDRFFTADPPEASELDAAARWAYDQFATYWSGLGELPARLISVGGTVTTLVALEHELVPYDSDFVHLRELTLDAVERQLGRMQGLTVAQIMQLKGMQAKRAPMMLAGSVIIRELMRSGGYRALTVSESSLLAGVVATVDETLRGTTPVVGWTPALA